MGFFQNCSKIAAVDLQTNLADGKVSATGNAVDETSNAVLTTALDDAEEVQQPVVVQPRAPIVNVEEPKARIIATEPKQEIKREPKPEEHNTNAANTVPVAAPVVEVAQPAPGSSDERQALALCFDKRGKRTVHGPVLQGLRGSNDIETDQISEILDNRGKLVVRSLGRSGHIGLIADSGGNITICGMDIDLIENTHGNLTLVGCRVKVLRGVKGTVKSFGTTIEQTDAKINYKN